MTPAPLPRHKTKIVCTIGPACESPEMLEKMILAGMNVARLNFSHGDFDSHREIIGRVRKASESTGRRVAIMADLPGPKIRIGRIADEPIELKTGDRITLTTEEAPGDAGRVTVNFDALPRVVKRGDALFLNDGLIELEVENAGGSEVCCLVRAGGELRSRKGLNLPGVDLGISAFTGRDRECLEFALGEGVDAVSQSFVSRAADVAAVRDAAAAQGGAPFIIAKIERAEALGRIGEILEAADGIMIARGDLGVEVPIERMAVIQKELMAKAVERGRPVITATQMLESMTVSRRPTRAEATDVANAIFDGTDCVMLSGESATGNYPLEAVRMLAEIASATEPHRPRHRLREVLKNYAMDGDVSRVDLITLSVQHTLERILPAAVIVPTVSGATARNIARFRPDAWICAVSPVEETCGHLLFSYGAWPVHEPRHPDTWNGYAREWVRDHSLKGELALLVEGPSAKNPEANHRLELIEL